LTKFNCFCNITNKNKRELCTIGQDLEIETTKAFRDLGPLCWSNKNYVESLTITSYSLNRKLRWYDKN
jgi:hypothetical protein